MRVRDYTAAVIGLKQKGVSDTDIIEGLKRVLNRRGHMKLYPKILHAILSSIEHEKDRDAVTLVLAKDEDQVRFKMSIDEAKTHIRGTAENIEIDETITGGFILKNRTQKLDRSYKKSLLTLYRLVTKA